MLTFATLRERWASFAGGFTVLVLGMTMVSMSVLALASAGARVPERLAGAPVFVSVPMPERGDGDFAPDRPWSPDMVASLRERLAAIPGVAHAIPDRTFYAQPVIGGRPVAGEQGYAWSAAMLAPYRLTAGTAPREGEVALDRSLGLAPGARVPVLTVHGPVTYTVSGTVNGPGVYLSDAEAARVSAGVRAIGLVTEPGADIPAVAAAARAAAGPAGVVRTGDGRGVLESRDHERTRWIGLQVLTGMAALSAFVSVLVVASAFAVGVAQRRREFGLLRAIGATPRQVRRMVYGEALVVGVVATAGGVAAGASLGPVLGDLLVRVGFEPPGFAVEVSPPPLAGSFAVGVVVTLAGVWSASRRAARIPPLEALREAEVDDRPMPLVRWIAGAACCALGLAAAADAAASDGSDAFVMSGLVAAMGVIAGLALLSPAVVPPVARLLSWPLARGRGATGMLVRESALTAVRRTAATATPVLVTVGCTVLITGMVQTTAAGFAQARATTIRADAVIVPDGTPGLTDAAASAGGAESSLFSGLFEPDGGVLSVIGATPELLERAGDVQVVSGSLDALRGDDRVLVADWLAADRGLRPGAKLPVSFEDGTSASPTVAGVIRDADADVLLSRSLLRAHDPVALAREAYVAGAPTPPGAGARVVDVTTYAVEADAQEDRLVWIATALLVLVSTVYAGAAIVNTMVMSAAGRVRDLTVLRLSGATGRQVAWAVAAEAVLVVLLGTGLGLVVALPALLGMRRAFTTAMHTDVPLVVPWPLITGVIAVCLTLAACSAALAARPATRHAARR
ncbi:ABC transporter permease [Sphaerisporangium melleum]|uniref:ABC transporter permease n=1 Tax=Sphaerisporangium melleum TaxID=321316 RepID=A0A917R053_9ACTN|nr:ABC transporter permease [Sphaerisporangium melleum]GGK81411.1 ABC transporter permease [Sphaerisporangium melleum]GII73851.1 ABC transporter permease [Sphaerisporangium melleum]